MSKSRTLSDFRAAHDQNVIIPTKIRAALAAMLKEGPEQWEYELEFLKRAGVSTTQLAQFRDQFEAHVVVAGTGKSGGKRVWFADPKIAKKVRDNA